MWFFGVVDQNSEMIFFEDHNIEFVSNISKQIISAQCLSIKKGKFVENLNISENFINYCRLFNFKTDFSLFFYLGMSLANYGLVIDYEKALYTLNCIYQSLYFSMVSLIGYKEMHKKEGNFGNRKEVRKIKIFFYFFLARNGILFFLNLYFFIFLNF